MKRQASVFADHVSSCLLLLVFLDSVLFCNGKLQGAEVFTMYNRIMAAVFDVVEHVVNVTTVKRL